MADTSVEIKRPVVVKVIMTDEFRKQIVSEARETISRLDENIIAIEGQGNDAIKNVESQDPQQALEMKRQMEEDKCRLAQMKAELEWKIKEVENVDNGAELPYRVLEGPVLLSVGDDILEKLTKTEVVIKDWKVVEIRNP